MNSDGCDWSRFAGSLAPDPIAVIDLQGTVRWVNDAALLADPGDEWVGTNIVDRVHPDDQISVLVSMSSVTEKDGPGTLIDVRLRHSDGHYRPYEARGHSATIGDTDVIVTTLREVTDRHRWELARGSTEAFQTIMQYSATLTVLVDTAGLILSASASLPRQLGHDIEKSENRPFVRLVAPDDRTKISDVFADGIVDENGKRSKLITLRLVHRDGQVIPYEMSIVDLRDDNVVGGFVISGHDVTELSAARDRLAYLATHDVLTALPNRTLFIERLAEARARTKRSGTPYIVFFCDLDGFKEVNDEYGHGEGDRVLARVGDQLRTALREVDFIGRLGGDEFVALAEGIDKTIADEIVVRIEAAVEATRSPTPIGVSVGYTFGEPDDHDLDVLSRADAEMYRRKCDRKGGGTLGGREPTTQGEC